MSWKITKTSNGTPELRDEPTPPSAGAGEGGAGDAGTPPAEPTPPRNVRTEIEEARERITDLQGRLDRQSIEAELERELRRAGLVDQSAHDVARMLGRDCKYKEGLIIDPAWNTGAESIAGWFLSGVKGQALLAESKRQREAGLERQESWDIQRAVEDPAYMALWKQSEPETFKEAWHKFIRSKAKGQPSTSTPIPRSATAPEGGPVGPTGTLDMARALSDPDYMKDFKEKHPEIWQHEFDKHLRKVAKQTRGW